MTSKRVPIDRNRKAAIDDEIIDAYENALRLQKQHIAFYKAEDKLEGLLGRTFEYPRVMEVDPDDDSMSGLQGRPGETHRAARELRRQLVEALAARRGNGPRSAGK